MLLFSVLIISEYVVMVLYMFIKKQVLLCFLHLISFKCAFGFYSIQPHMRSTAWLIDVVICPGGHFTYINSHFL